MESLITHIQEHMVEYGVGAVFVVAFIFFTRKWTLPLIQWGLELCIYSAAFHIVVHYVIAVAEWFNFESQMKMLKDQRTHAGWETPLIEFWRRDLYKPGWIFWIEIIFVVGAFILMIRYRPMTTQKPGRKREALRKGVAPQVRPQGRSAGPKGRY